MSYLSSTRINFWGGFSTNVCTANNNDVIPLMDPVTSELREPYKSMSADEIEQRLREPNKKDYTNAGWNYYGDHRVSFPNAKISSAGAPGAVSTQDRLVDLPIKLIGGAVMVDIDPTGGSGTQIFVGGIQIGHDANPILSIPYETHCYSYYVAPRVVPKKQQQKQHHGFAAAGASWQFGIPKSALPALAPETAAKYPSLQQLLTEAQRGQGLVVRFTCFEVTPYLTATELAKDFAAGKKTQNMALGYTIGTIGVWDVGEYATSMEGRLLHTTEKKPNSRKYALAYVDEKAKRVSLDLVSAIAKDGYRAKPTDLSKLGPNVDVGKLVLATKAGPLKTFDPRPQDYYKYGGIVDLMDVDVSQLDGQAIQIQGRDGTYLTESRYRVQSEKRGVYLDLHEESLSSTDIELKVTEFGKPPKNVVNIGTNIVTSSNHEWDTPGLKIINKLAKENVFTVTATSPGLCLLNFTAPETSPFFINFRVFPQDDYSKLIAQGNIPWETVYDEVLKYYDVIFRAMNLLFPLGSEFWVKKSSSAIRTLTSPDNFESPSYMPITRSMSAGKRKLLLTFLGFSEKDLG